MPDPSTLVEDAEYSVPSAHFDNRIIHGDNLVALRDLEREFTGRVKCIYIDPPYNTGRKFDYYDDGRSQSQWIHMMRDRLVAARRLLSTDGSVWISIDDRGVHHLKILCDEVLGKDAYRNTITWNKRYTVSNNAKGVANVTEFVLLYANPDFRIRLLPLSEKALAQYSNPDNDARGLWRTAPYYSQVAPHRRPSLCYDIRNPHTGHLARNVDRSWKFSLERHARHVAENRLWWGANGENTTPQLKIFLSEGRGGMLPTTWWRWEDVGNTDDARREMKGLFGINEPFETPKPERLILRVLALATEPGDVILDCFAGSGTTGAVAHKMGRRWLMVEKGEHCVTHIVARLRKVVDGTDQGGVSKAVSWLGGGGFRYFRYGERPKPAEPPRPAAPLGDGLDLDDFLADRPGLFTEEPEPAPRRLTSRRPSGQEQSP